MRTQKFLLAAALGSAVVVVALLRALKVEKEFDTIYEVSEKDIVSDLPGARLHLETPAL